MESEKSGRALNHPNAVTMATSSDDIARQARQGSIAAIIQILNDKLANSGVRTRAVFDNGILQLLCEAATIEQLEQNVLVADIQGILETISPRNVRRVKINSRIVREQQLLWLEEIKRDPENQLLWSQQVVLAHPNFLQRWLEDLRSAFPSRRDALAQLSQQQTREQQQFRRGILGGVGLAAAIGVGIVVVQHIQSSGDRVPLEPVASVSPVLTQASPVVVKPVVKSLSPGSSNASDPFVKAIRLAEQATRSGQSAQSTADWLAVAAQWQQASDLMGQVPDKDPRHKTAQERIEFYRQNSQTALAQAQKQQSSP